MPVLTADHTLTATNTAQIFTLPLDYHILKAVTIQQVNPITATADAYAQIAILSGGDNIENLVALLASGYVGPFSPVYWTGSIPAESGLSIAAIVTGYTGKHFRLSSILWKIRIDEKGEFRADP